MGREGGREREREREVGNTRLQRLERCEVEV